MLFKARNCLKCYPHYWVLGYLCYGSTWLRLHRWQPNCRKLWHNLRRLHQEEQQAKTKLAEVAAIMQAWLDKRGHDRCWYYPELFRQLCDTLGLDHAQLDVPRLTLAEIQDGCHRWQADEYRLPVDEVVNQELTRCQGVTEMAQGYAARRRHLKYYQDVRGFLEKCSGAVLDVGCNDVDLVCAGKFTSRTTIDMVQRPALPGVEAIWDNYLTWQAPQVYEWVLCMQVLEHVEDPARFCAKLQRDGLNVLVTVPFEWPKGTCKHHLHDPIGHDKLASWMGRKPTQWHTIKENDGLVRLVAIYEGGHSAPGNSE